MRRTAASVLLTGLIALASVPATAAPGGLVITLNSEGFVPGEETDPVETLRVPAGSELTFLQMDAFMGHNVTSDARKPDRTRLFSSPTLQFMATGDVKGVNALPVGSYGFHCSVHLAMRGKLVIV